MRGEKSDFDEYFHFVSTPISCDYLMSAMLILLPFVSLVLLAWYVDCTDVAHDAFKPNKGP